MASVFKRHRIKPIPEGAEIIARKSGEVARWKDGRGRTKSAPLVDDGDGPRVRIEDNRWTIAYEHHTGERRTFGGFTDKDATAKLASKVEALVALQLASARPSGDLRAWLDSSPVDLLNRFAAHDLIDGEGFAVGRKLADHVADYEAYLSKVKKRAASHVEQTVQRIERVMAEAGARHWQELKPTKIEAALADVQKRHKLTLQSRNAYLVAFKAFGAWMVRNGKATHNPTAGIEPAEVDRREHRRALADDEAESLIAAAEAGEPFIRRTRAGKAHFDKHGEDMAGGVRYAIEGMERSLLYRFAIETGLRSGTIRRLAVADFELDGDEPSVTVRGEAATKEKRTRLIPLTPGTAALLADGFDGRLRTAAAFNMPGRDAVAAMLRDDLAAARAAWIAEGANAEDRAKRAESDYLAAIDAEGRRIDFHALRTTCGSMLERAGVAASVAMKVTGHRTESVLRDHYHRANQSEVRAAVNAVALTRRAVGDGCAPARNNTRNSTRAPGTERHGAAFCGKIEDENASTKTDESESSAKINPAIDGVYRSTRGRTRTPNLLIRSQVLYPIELHARERTGDDMGGLTERQGDVAAAFSASIGLMAKRSLGSCSAIMILRIFATMSGCLAAMSLDSAGSFDRS